MENQKRIRPFVLSGETLKVVTGCGDSYITVNSDKDGMFEVFISLGKGGGCAFAQNEAIGRMVSLALRFNIPVNEICKQLSGIHCHSPFGNGESRVTSCADAIATAIKQCIKES
jgi:ribonucleoside-diphosphate reductase alpha chain